MKLIIANTVIGKPGNIGLRYSKILRRNEELSGSVIYHYCRYSLDDFDGCLSLGILGRLPRLLNALRIYIFKSFNHRKWDILWFEFLFIFRVVPLLLFNRDKNNVALVNEPSVFIIKWLRKFNFKIIYDFPIAPFSYADKFVSKFGYGHGINPNSYIGNREKLCYSLVDEFIVPSEFVYHEIFDYSCEKKIWNIPFGIDVIEHSDVSLEEKEADKIKFYFAGVINKRKGIHNILEVWGDFDNDCELHLCGRLFPEIKQILDRRNFKNVFTPGFVKFNDYISSPGVYVFPSLLEGSSKSIYEAMHAGIPVICTNESGSIVRNGIDGWIIDTMSPSSIEEKMKSFIDDRKLISTMGRRAQESVKLYSWERYSDSVLRVIN